MQRINVTFTLRRSISVFYESLQIAFPNNVLVSQFRGCLSPYGREGRGQQSSLAFKVTWTKNSLLKTADFDRVKKIFFTVSLRNFNQSML